MAVVVEVSAAGMIALSGVNGEYSCFYLPIIEKDERACLLLSLRWTTGDMCTVRWVVGEEECSILALFVFTTWLSCDCLCDQFGKYDPLDHELDFVAPVTLINVSELTPMHIRYPNQVDVLSRLPLLHR